jgi:integrase
MEQSVANRLEQYKERCDLRESSIEILDRAGRWFVAMAGDKAVDRISYSDIDDFKRWLIRPRQRTEHTPNIYTPSRATANTYLSILKPFFAWLRKRGYIRQDPFDGIRLYVVPEKKFDVYRVEEIGRVLMVAGPLWRLIVCLALSGMREAEILNLCIREIDFEKNLILVTPKKDTRYTWRWDIKDSNQRYIGLDESVVRLLVERCENPQHKDMPYVCLKESYWRRNLELRDAGELKHRLRNCPWGNFDRDFKALLRRARVRPKRFHDLRSTFASERYNDDYGLKELQYLMGHSSIQTTARYVRNIEEQKLVARSGRTFKKYYASNV